MRRSFLIAGAAALVSTAAWAFPWDIDMNDADFYRAFEWAMSDLPEGVVSRNMYVANHDRLTPEGQALTNPYGADAAAVANGAVMFKTYCETCHGPEGKGGAAVVKNDPDAGIKRYPVPPPQLSGTGAISALRSDGYMYLTIRNGSAIMNGYDVQMDDHEMWDVVSYIRTLEGAQHTPPAPPAPE